VDAEINGILSGDQIEGTFAQGNIKIRGSDQWRGTGKKPGPGAPTVKSSNFG
jgi:hypothetical protein